MPKKGAKLTDKERADLDAAREKSRSPEAKKKRAASLAVTNAIKGNLGFSGRLTPLVEDYLRSVLITPDEHGKTYISNFIDAFLKEAKEDPCSRAGQLFASAIFSSELLKQLDEQANKEMTKDLAFAEYRIRQTLYNKQQEVFDNCKDKIIQVINSRRTGKTELSGRLLAKRILRPNQHCVYINRSFDAAVRQIKKPLETALSVVNMDYTGTVQGGKLEFNNGSWILIIGNNNVGDVNKLRGESIALCICDECGHMRNTRQLIEEVISPAMIDYADSQLIFTGTPPRTAINYMQELWDNTNIKHYHWDYRDNPFLPNRDKVLDEVCQLHGCTPEDAFIQREYFGIMGAIDDSALIFKGWKKASALPNQTWTNAYVAVDWGHEDKAAVVSCLANSATKEMKVVKVWSESKHGTSEICEHVKEQVEELVSKYNIATVPWVICDTDQKTATYDLVKVYKLKNVYCAYKYDKDMALDQLAEWLRTGTISVLDKECKELENDLNNTLWERDEETDKIKHKIDDTIWHPNAAMALLYASRVFAVHVLGLTENNKVGRNILEGR